MSNSRNLEALGDELLETLIFDDDRVFERLHFSCVSDEFVEKCSSGLLTDPTTVAAKQHLEAIVQHARGEKGEEFIEEFDDPEIGRIVSKEPEGAVMYDALSTVFKYIEDFDPVGPVARRNSKNSFKSRYEFETLSDWSAQGYPVFSPDFTLIDETVPVTHYDSGKCSVMWHGQSAFCQIKPAEIQGPKYKNPPLYGGVKRIVTEAAGYACLHLSSRPFQLFSVALLIFGAHFCVAIFDREGATFSPIHDMWADLSLFIRVIRTLTRHASPQDLGQDPTISILPAEAHASWVERVQGEVHVPLGPSEHYPTFCLNGVSKFANRTFLTIGKPIWVSFSLLGRGTFVWLVADKETGEVFILKTSWRRPDMVAESHVYESIEGHHPALSAFECGGDVLFPQSSNCYISVQQLRQPGLKNSCSQVTDEGIVLHRLFMKSYGRPITEWTSYKELLEAVRAAISAHAFLWEQGILHRDIHPGNVLLSAPLPGQESPHAAGLLLDLEFAHVGGLTEGHLNRDRDPFTDARTAERGCSALRGGIMTGSAHFMALEVLEAILLRRDVVVDYKPHHDLESFIYVLAYALFGGLLMAESHPELQQIPERRVSQARESFCDSFGLMRIMKIYTDRRGILPLEPARFLRDYVPEPVAILLKDLEERHLRSQHGWGPQIFLTHETLLASLDKAIDML